MSHKIYKIPFPLFRDHPIVPKAALGEDVIFIEEEEGNKSTFSIIFKTSFGSVNFDLSSRIIYKESSGMFGAVEKSTEQPVGTSIVESARQICLNYIKSS